MMEGDETASGRNDKTGDQGQADGDTAEASGVAKAPAAEAQAPAVPEGTVASERVDPLAEAQAEATRLKDAWLRTAADFDNFRKRSRRELEEARRSGREDLLRALLPVFDNLGRAIQSAQRSTDVKAMSEGLSMVERQFVEALEREGITKVKTVGQAFDPSCHEAIQQVDTDDYEPGTVMAEVQPGYLQGERLLRAAMVVVARAKSTSSAAEA